MITRGIKHYNINDLKKHMYATIDAKQLELMIMDGQIDLKSEDHTNVETFSTKGLSFFIGDYVIEVVPRMIIKLLLTLRDYRKMQEDPIKNSQEIEQNIIDTENQIFEFSESMESKSVRLSTPSYFVIYMEPDEGMRQLTGVYSGKPIDIISYLSDSRVYELENGAQRFAEDGIPDDVYYYYDDEGTLKYSLNPADGKQVGTE